MAYQANGMNYPNTGWNPYSVPQPPSYQPMYQPQYSAGVPAYTPPTYTPSQNQVYTPKPINGHTVKSDTDIVPNDVPMDGSVSLFPLEDYSCIFAKMWGKDGKITTTKFVPVPADEDYTPTPGFEDEMRARMDELKELIQKRGGKQYHQNVQNRRKQEGDQNA